LSGGKMPFLMPHRYSNSI